MQVLDFLEHKSNMDHSSKLVTLAILFGVSGIVSSWADEHHHAAEPPPAERRSHVSSEQLATILNAAKCAEPPITLQLPPLPAGVQELNFQEFYQMPVGPRGLEPSAKLLSLHGKNVRILGYMGEMQRANKRQFIFSAVPLKPQPEEYGLCDDIPGVHVLVTVQGNLEEQVPFTPGPLLLTGILAVGNYVQGGETSFVRLLLDLPLTAPTQLQSY